MYAESIGETKPCVQRLQIRGFGFVGLKTGRQPS